ncbi:hypothetical protein GCM10010250_30600 [Streptomyces althioticus]|nr:hypothetical protein GCM10010250_30600 [Streptomyces althioticus]
MHVTGTVPPPAPAPQDTPEGAPDGTGRRTRRFGLPVATALVMGNIIGGGIFLLPASIAPYGTISLLAFGVLTVGAIALALVFGRLAERDPRTGGPYVYAREAFGDFAGFLAAWAYWITTWVSNAALAVAAVGYLDVLIPVGEHRWTACLAALVIQWLPALANYAGTRYVGAVQVVSTVLKLVPLLLVAVGGLFFFDAGNLGPFRAGGESAMGAVSAAAAILLFSYLGVESAAVSAGEVRDPRRTVGRATVIGTAGAAVVYLLGTLAVFGTVAHDRLVESGAPFSDAVNGMFGGTWGGWAVALAALVSMTGCLNGWTLLSAQTSYAAAKDGLFPAPPGPQATRRADGRRRRHRAPRLPAHRVQLRLRHGPRVRDAGPGHHLHGDRPVPARDGRAALPPPVRAAGPRRPRPPGPRPGRRLGRRRVLAVAGRRRRVPGRLPGCAVPLRRRAGVRRHAGPQAAHGCPRHHHRPVTVTGGRRGCP